MHSYAEATHVLTNGVSLAWSLTFSLLAFIIIAGLLFLFALKAGRDALVAAILALYIGFALYILFPYAGALAVGDSAVTKSISAIVLYVVFTGIAYYIVRRVSGSVLLLGGNAGAIALALLTSGFLIALAYHSFSVEDVYAFTPTIKTYFAPAQYFFWWFSAPLAGVLVLAR
jgi:hypothetical protein